MFQGSLFYTKRVSIALLFFVGFIVNIKAQESNSFVDQVWFQYYNKSNFSEKWSLSTDMGYRLKEGSFVDVSQYFIRSGLGYQISPSFRVLLGGAIFKTHSSWDVRTIEYRPYQQLSSKHKFGKISFGNRFRIEQRFINNTSDNSFSFNSYNFRFRYRFLFNIPLVTLSKKDPNKKLNLVIGDEIIFSTSKTEFFDFDAQNRILMGPSVKINKNNTFFVLINFTSVTKDLPQISDEYGVLWVGYKQTLNFIK